MEFIAKKLTDYILEKNVIEKENYDIYKFGFEYFFETAFSFISAMIIAFFMHGIPEALFFSFFFLMTRSYTGGLHLKTFKGCYTFSCLLLIICLLITKNLKASTAVSVCVYMIALLTIIIVGPVDHPNKTVDEADNKRFILKSYVILGISVVTAIILVITKSRHYLFLEAVTFAAIAITGILGKLYNRYTGV